MFHVCAQTDTTGVGFSFLCPNGTLFNQKVMVCDWYYNVQCLNSDLYYDVNNYFKIEDKNKKQILERIKKMMAYPFTQNVEVSTNEPNSITFKTLNMVGNNKMLKSFISTATLYSIDSWLTHVFFYILTSDPLLIIKMYDEDDDGDKDNYNTFPNTESQLDLERNSIKPDKNIFGGRIYISSLGELSTDLMDALDLNKIKFIRTSSDSLPDSET